MLTISPSSPCMQCSLVSTSIKSCYFLHFQILKNSSISNFSLYRAIRPPRVARRHVNPLSLNQIIFQKINFYFDSKFTYFSIFLKTFSCDMFVLFDLPHIVPVLTINTKATLRCIEFSAPLK